MNSSAALLLLLAANPAHSGSGQCEAHIFPTETIQGFTSLGDYGLLSDLLSGGPVPEDQLREQIKADSQFDIASRLMARSGRLEGFSFVEHTDPVDFKTSTKQKQRLTASSLPCYVEIVVNYISFSDTALSKKKVGVHFVTRDFRERPEKPKILKLGGAAAMAPYVKPAQSEGEQPEVDFVGVYSEAFEAAIARFWKR